MYQSTHTYFYLLSFIAPAPDVVVTPVDLVPYRGNTTLQCSITSLAMPIVQWTSTADDMSFTVEDLVMSDNNTYISIVELHSVANGNVGNYTCEATNEGGTTNDTVSVMLGNQYVVGCKIFKDAYILSTFSCMHVPMQVHVSHFCGLKISCACRN